MNSEQKGICKHISKNEEKCTLPADKSCEDKGYFYNYKYCIAHEKEDSNLDMKHECMMINKNEQCFNDGDYSVLKEGKCSFKFSDKDYCMFEATKEEYCLYHNNYFESVNKLSNEERKMFFSTLSYFLTEKEADEKVEVQSSKDNDIFEKLKKELETNHRAKCDHRTYIENDGEMRCKNIARSIIKNYGNYSKVCDDHLFLSFDYPEDME